MQSRPAKGRQPSARPSSQPGTRPSQASQARPKAARRPHRPILGCLGAANRLPLNQGGEDPGSVGAPTLVLATVGGDIGVGVAVRRGRRDWRERRRWDGVEVIGEAGRPRRRAVASVGEWRGATTTIHGATASVPWERERGRRQGWWALPRTMAASTASVMVSTITFMEGTGLAIFYLEVERRKSGEIPANSSPSYSAFQRQRWKKLACVITC
jgi:hypothetical protein